MNWRLALLVMRTRSLRRWALIPIISGQLILSACAQVPYLDGPLPISPALQEAIDLKIEPFPDIPTGIHLTYTSVGKVPWESIQVTPTQRHILSGYYIIDETADGLLKKTVFSQNMTIQRHGDNKAVSIPFDVKLDELVFDEWGKVWEYKDNAENFPKRSPAEWVPQEDWEKIRDGIVGSDDKSARFAANIWSVLFAHPRFSLDEVSLGSEIFPSTKKQFLEIFSDELLSAIYIGGFYGELSKKDKEILSNYENREEFQKKIRGYNVYKQYSAGLEYSSDVRIRGRFIMGGREYLVASGTVRLKGSSESASWYNQTHMDWLIDPDTGHVALFKSTEKTNTTNSSGEFGDEIENSTVGIFQLE